MLPPKFTSRGAAGSAAHAAPRRARFPQMASPTADLAHCGGTLIRHPQMSRDIYSARAARRVIRLPWEMRMIWHNGQELRR